MPLLYIKYIKINYTFKKVVPNATTFTPLDIENAHFCYSIQITKYIYCSSPSFAPGIVSDKMKSLNIS